MTGRLFTLRLGYVPLCDAALPLIAQGLGFDRAEGVRLDLVRESSWANIRDRLAVGHIDAAHALAALPLAARLGLTPLRGVAIAPMSLGGGANGFVFGREAAAMRAPLADADGADLQNPALWGAALRRLVKARRATGAPAPTLAMVHEFSTHHYALRLWLEAQGLRAGEDVRLIVLAPSLTADALAQGAIDGFCAGEPWGAVAEAQGAGVHAFNARAILPEALDKVLAVVADVARREPAAVMALMRALLRAARWADDPANREALARRLAEALRTTADTTRIGLSRGLMLGPPTALRPGGAQARLLADQMIRLGQWGGSVEAIQTAAQNVFAPDLYDAATADF